MKTIHSKILIVDDNAFYLSVLKTILKDVEVEIYMASSGEEALRLINENNFALAVLDIEMPVMNGFELASHIRNLHNRDLLPIIFLTAYFSDDMQMFKGYDNGAIDYLTKPVNRVMFISKVKIFLELDKQKRKLLANKESLQKSKMELEQNQREIRFQNITLQKTQAEMDESRKKYIKLYDFAPTGYFTIDSAGKMFDINLKAASMFGQEQSRLINLDFKSFIAPEMLSVTDDFLAEVFDNKANSGYELKLIPINGKTVYVFLEGALTDRKQKCLMSMVDITDRKEAQMAMEESESLYHSLLKTSPDGIILISLDGKIIEASDIAISLLGNNNKEDIEGMPVIQFVPRESRRTLIRIYNSTLKNGIVQNLELKLNRLDKTEFTGEVSSSQIRDNNGLIKAYMAVIRDISERKFFEKQLRHSERMAGIGELATGMAHEINQPLNTMSMTIDNIIFAIENKTINESYLKAKIEKVFDNITRIKKIIDHVRTFSRDQDDFVHGQFDIVTSINNCISMISEQMNHHEINLTFKNSPEIPMITGNTYRFEQVILNLLFNAKDAIDEKKKNLRKDFRKKIDITADFTDNQIIIEIKDNGIGINQKDIDKVLLPFYTTKTPGQGTGLGLSISYGIIKELGGEIDLQSKLNQGTTVLIKIPVQEVKSKKYV
ncbi:MAG TPA: hybrid sensor histidine kinase/response regulator [Prolixibacteraceae bacterium]|nr:hybrid sensor histidine kinase/response regulator [Prolixibacteraceae bacterium]